MATTIGGLSNNGATLGKVTGVLNPNNTSGAGTSAYNPSLNMSIAPKPPAHTTPPHNPAPPIKTVVTSPDGSTTAHTYAPPGGKTPATPPAPQTPPQQLAPDDPSNKYNTSTGQLNTKYPGYINPTPPGPQVGSASSNAQTLLNSGNQTPQEQQTYQGLIGQSQNANPIAQTAGQNLNSLGLGGNDSPEVMAAIKDLQDLQAKYAGNTRNIAGTAGFLTQASGEQGLQNQQYATLLGAAQSRLSNALSEQGQRISASSAAGGIGNSIQGLLQGALGTANSAAQTTAGRATGAAGTVFGGSLPGQISGSTRLYNPLDPTGANSGTSGIIQGANNQFTYDTAISYQQGLQNLKAADGIQNQIISTLQSNPTLNSTPISLITNLNELLSGQTSVPGQQLLAQQIKQYIDTLGLDPATVTSIASQQKGTLAQLLDSLRQTAQTQTDAKNPANVGSTSTSGSTGTVGQIGGYKNNGAF